MMYVYMYVCMLYVCMNATKVGTTGQTYIKTPLLVLACMFAKEVQLSIFRQIIDLIETQFQCKIQLFLLKLQNDLTKKLNKPKTSWTLKY